MRALPTIATAALFAFAATAALASGGSSPDRTGGRIAGEDRFETAAEIARAAFPEGATTAYLARHDVFTDALAASSLADGPVLLTTPCGPIPQAVLTALDDLGVSRITALGGTAAVADQMVAQAVAGHRDETLACPGTVPSTAQGLSLMADPDAGSVRLLLGNDRDTSVTVGRQYVLERLQGGGFDPLDPPVGPFQSDAVLVEPGGVFQVAEIGPSVVRHGAATEVEDGTYRARLTADGVELAVTFDYERP